MHRVVILRVVWVMIFAVALQTAVGCQQLKNARSDWSLGKRQGQQDASATSLAASDIERAQADMKFKFARTLEQTGKVDQAANGYREVLKIDGKHAGAHHRLAILAELEGAHAQANDHFQTALKHDPENAELLCDYGYSLYLHSQWPEAETHLRHALKNVPDLARAHNNLGMIQARTGRIADSVASFRAAGSSPAKSRANAAFALMLDDRWPEARRELEIALAQEPNSHGIKQRMTELDAVMAQISPPTPVAPVSNLQQRAPAANSNSTAKFILDPSSPQAAFPVAQYVSNGGG